MIAFANFFALTALTNMLLDKILGKRLHHAFIIYDVGDGPILIYRGHRSRIKEFLIDLRQGAKTFYLDSQAKGPYLILVAQNEPGQPAEMVVYNKSRNPVLEYQVGDRPLVGQLFAHGMSSDYNHQSIVHTLYAPMYNNVYITTNQEFSCSTAIVEHPELCEHLLLCGRSIFYFMDLLLKQQDKTEDQKDNQTKGRVV